MIYPLIILGAGASYDSISNHNLLPATKQADLKQWKPPLTNNIFDTSRFDEIIQKYKGVEKISGETFQIREDYSLENLITDILNNEAQKNNDWYGYLMSFKFYLQCLFYTITEKYFYHTNNYRILLSQIRLNNNNKACFVNFNYDLLLEKHIFDNDKSINIDDYIKGDIKVVKIHGAYNWFRPFNKGDKTDENFRKGRDHLIFNAKKVLEEENNFEKINNGFPQPIIKNNFLNWDLYEEGSNMFPDEVLYYTPEIALPMNRKKYFVCPDKHIQELKNRLKEIDRIIIIGWKGVDEFLLNILRDELENKNIPVFIVSPRSSIEIGKRINREYNLQTFPIEQSFSDFLKNDSCKKVLSIQDPIEIMNQINFDSYNNL